MSFSLVNRGFCACGFGRQLCAKVSYLKERRRPAGCYASTRRWPATLPEYDDLHPLLAAVRPRSRTAGYPGGCNKLSGCRVAPLKYASLKSSSAETVISEVSSRLLDCAIRTLT